MATGAPPHFGAHPVQVMNLIVASPPPVLEGDHFSKAFKEFVALCCVKVRQTGGRAENIGETGGEGETGGGSGREQRRAGAAGRTCCRVLCFEFISARDRDAAWLPPAALLGSALLRQDPERRPTLTQLLRHAFIKKARKTAEIKIMMQGGTLR